ncbi:hypothetical protein K1719_017954 [Acacia pycnantha]|nr:hypothetical protein K1719_017954 [Acacia pycnantha]
MDEQPQDRNLAWAQEAIDFLDEVERRFEAVGEVEKYRQFLCVIINYSGSKNSLHRMVSRIFKGHRDLLLTFEHFLEG